ncbi:MAG TPA: hypothetical protein PKG48_04730 [Bacteroidales bacterium]|nr:hypothetical protein [Bacteroidales bacterium]HPS61697.1 hypothetical protein [Bacteroidales bacterium]
MKRLILLILTSFSFLSFSHSQSIIALDHATGGSEFFTRLDSAIAHATGSDYIYLPGTTLMQIDDVVIDKPVHIIGAGINPDSSMATGITYLTGNITVVAGADNGSLQGIMLNGTLTFGTSHANQHVSSYYVSRCNLATLYLSYNGTDTTTSSFLFRENIIRGHVYGGFSNAVFRNNIFEAQLNYFYGATFANNDFLWGSTRTINAFIRNSTFSNNIFKHYCVAYYGYSPLSSYNNNYYNNMFNGPLQFSSDYYGCIPDGNGIGFISGNLENVQNALIYTSQSGYTYDIHHNFHLAAGSPGINAGTDGTDIGIYGGSESFKDGSLPVNPHIRFQSVAGSTSPNGMLNIHYKVAAQER